ncbi:MAG: hypothetical protein ACQGVK_02730 [Myxococcota bacterium]
MLVQGLHVGDADLAHVGLGHEGHEVAANVALVEKGRRRGERARDVPIDRQLDLGLQPALRVGGEGQRLAPIRVGREGAEDQGGVDLLRNLLSPSLVGLRRSDAPLATPARVVGVNPPRAAIPSDL